MLLVLLPPRPRTLHEALSTQSLFFVHPGSRGSAGAIPLDSTPAGVPFQCSYFSTLQVPDGRVQHDRSHTNPVTALQAERCTNHNPTSSVLLPLQAVAQLEHKNTSL